MDQTSWAISYLKAAVESGVHDACQAVVGRGDLKLLLLLLA